MNPHLIDERAEPPLRDVIGRLLGAASEASIAITHVRLAAVDLTAAETGRVQHCRILLGRLDARAFDGFGLPAPSLAPLLRFITSPRVEIRSVGMAAWSPDFSIYRGLDAADGASRDACLVGAHWFREPPGGAAPAFTCLLTEPAAVRLAMRRFDELWHEGYDVRDTVLAAVQQFAHGA
jgi:hypothetical protein